jgi:hypothetical protein
MCFLWLQIPIYTIGMRTSEGADRWRRFPFQSFRDASAASEKKALFPFDVYFSELGAVIESILLFYNEKRGV